MWILGVTFVAKMSLQKINTLIYKYLQNNNYSSTVLGDAQYIPYYHGKLIE